MNVKKKDVLLVFIVFTVVTSSWVVPVIKSDDEEINPFLYFYPPSNSFGMSSYKAVNPVFLKQLLKDNINWNLEYKRYSYSDWVEGNEYLDIDLKWVDDSFYKITLNFSCPVDVYHARFTMDFSVNVLDYIEKNDSCVWFNYSTNEGNINLVFDYSDLKSINGLYFEKGIVNDWFFFRFGRYNIPSGFYSFDPIFGNSDSGSGYATLYYHSSNSEYIRSTYGMPLVTGEVQNISAYFSDVSQTINVQCAIYQYIDDDTDFAGNLLAVTESKDISSVGWHVFSLSTPYCVTAYTNYYLCIRPTGDYSGGGYVRLYSDQNNPDSFYKSNPIGITFDNPLTDEISSGYPAVLYASYTEGCGEQPCTDNCTISNLEMNGAGFVNHTVDVEDCEYHNFSVDIEDCLGDIDYINISVEGLGFTNHTDESNGTYWHNETDDLDCNTNYTLYINISCQDGNYKSYYWYWFVTEDCCEVSLDNVMVNGIDTNTTQYCFDYNATWLNVSYDVTSSCDDEIEFINVSFNNGSHIFYSQVTNEAEGSFWVNWSSPAIHFDCETNYTMLNFTIHDGDNCNDDWINATFWFNTCDCVEEPSGNISCCDCFNESCFRALLDEYISNYLEESDMDVTLTIGAGLAIFIIWLFFVSAILFSKNKYLWLLSSLFILTMVATTSGEFETGAQLFYIFASVFMALMGFVRFLNAILSERSMNV